MINLLKYYLLELKSLLLGIINLQHLKWSLIDDFLKRILTGVPSRLVCEVTPQLFVGGQFYRRGLKALQEWGITAVVNVRKNHVAKFEKEAGFEFFHLPTVDNQAPELEKLQEAVSFIDQNIKKSGKVYVHCYWGMGRGPTVAAAYLIKTGMNVEEAIETIHKVRPFIRPTKSQRERLKEFENSL